MRRFDFLFLGFLLSILLIIYRLFYWQIQAGEKLMILAESQQTDKIELPARRGRIFSSDGFPLVDNQEAYLVYADLTQFEENPVVVADQLAPLFIDKTLVATDSARLLENEKLKIQKRLESSGLVWVALKRKISKETKKAIEALELNGLDFERENIRFYPEASLSANLLGFLGSDAVGNDQGYFGLEGFYNLELKGRPGLIYQEKDALGQPILLGEFEEQKAGDGRDLILHLDRAVQFIVEEKLQMGIKEYAAKSGSVVIMEPKSGAVLAMASWPGYDPKNYSGYDQELYKNPLVADTFEPGSVFKLVIMAAALNEGAVTPETKCDQCAGPRQIGPDLIHTYDDQYYPNSTITEILTHSDNVGMVFIAEKLGLENLLRYLKDFGFDQKTGIDLEDEVVSKLRPNKEWRKIDLAAASFGQGIAITPIQMIRAVAAIANGGDLVIPQMVDKVKGEKKEIDIKPKIIRQVISSQTAKSLTKMMVSAVQNGFPHWQQYNLFDFQIAGKTGTAQIPLAGHYDKEKTIVSFVGFAPADKPKFVMLVTLCEPGSSPWGANTAAPLWFEIAKELFLYYGISP